MRTSLLSCCAPFCHASDDVRSHGQSARRYSREYQVFGARPLMGSKASASPAEPSATDGAGFASPRVSVFSLARWSWSQSALRVISIPKPVRTLRRHRRKRSMNKPSRRPASTTQRCSKQTTQIPHEACSRKDSSMPQNQQYSATQDMITSHRQLHHHHGQAYGCSPAVLDRAGQLRPL